jgi:hypothetical protein
MKFEDAIVESIKAFLGGNVPEKLAEMKEGGLTYTPQWFDAFEETIKNGGDVKDVKASAAPKEDDEDMELEGLGYAK